MRLGTAFLWLALAQGITLAASSEADYAEALRASGRGDPQLAMEQLKALVARDPEFGRAWIILAELHEKQTRLDEFEAWLGAGPRPGACMGRLELLRRRKIGDARFEEVARGCVEAFPDSFFVMARWIAGVPAERQKALGEEFARSAETRLALRFAAGFAQLEPADTIRWLEPLVALPLSAAQANEVDAALYFAYPDTDIRKAETARRLRIRALASGDAEWAFRSAGRLAEMARADQRFADALSLAREARGMAKELGRPVALYETIAGECLFRLGRLGEAIQEFEQASASGLGEGDTLRQANALGWLSDLHNESGDHSASIDYGLRGLQLAEKAKLTEIAADQHINLAFAWANLGQGPRALDSLREAEALLQSSPAEEWHARILADTSSLYLRLGQTGQALQAAERSVAVSGDNVVRRAEAHLLRAEALVAVRRYSDARQGLDEAAALAPEIPSYRARGRLAAGQIALDRAQFDSATAAFGEARDAAPGFPWLQVRAHAGLSDVHWRKGRMAEALAERQRAIEIVEAIRKLQVVGHRGSFLAPRIALYRDCTQLLLALGRVEEAFLMAERGRARELLDLKERRREADGNPVELAALRQASAAWQSAKGLANRRKADLDLQAAMDRYVVRATGSDSARGGPLGLAQIQQRMSAKAAVLHYTLDERRSVVFVVRRDKVRWFDLGPRAAVDAAVREARVELTAAPSRLTEARLEARLERAYDMLIQPAMPALQGVSELVVVGDGSLNTLPFEALIESSHGERASGSHLPPYLVSRYVIRYAPSATLGGESTKPDEGGSLTLLAYGDTAGVSGSAVSRTSALGRLPFSGVEVERIAALYPAGSRRVVTGVNASDQAFKNDPELERAGVVHLALHGFADDRWPMMSALVFAGDGLLRAYEILNLRITARVVVLSACDTGIGLETSGEGIASLRRAFLAAGARSIVASLWPVDDRMASQQMSEFHRALVRHGWNASEALREAQNWMIRNQSRHPHDWAVFTVMTGGRE